METAASLILCLAIMALGVAAICVDPAEDRRRAIEPPVPPPKPKGRPRGYRVAGRSRDSGLRRVYAVAAPSAESAATAARRWGVQVDSVQVDRES